MGKLFAIGDIHGTLDKLTALLDNVSPDPEEDTLIFIGDYIDRGGQAFEVVDFLVHLRQNFRHAVFLKGNHEAMLLNYLQGKERLFYLQNGGQQTLDSYLRNVKDLEDGFPIPAEHLAFFNSLSLFYETPEFIFVHAGLKENVPLEDQKPEDLLWIRDAFIHSRFDFGKRVVFGHSPFQEPLVESNKIGIDTGAVYGNRLTCVQLPEMEFYQA